MFFSLYSLHLSSGRRCQGGLVASFRQGVSSGSSLPLRVSCGYQYRFLRRFKSDQVQRVLIDDAQQGVFLINKKETYEGPCC